MASQSANADAEAPHSGNLDRRRIPEAWAHVIQASVESAALRRQRLTEIIESKILPQLRLDHRQATPDTVQLPNISSLVGEFADLVIRHEGKAAMAYFQTLADQGLSLEYLFRELLGPTARRLGELWEEDINTMLDVTRGLSHLQQLVRVFGTQYHDEAGNPLLNRCALLMPLPGEQHSFGITLVEEQFRRDGWQVWGGPSNSMKDVCSLVQTMWFDVVGISASRVGNASAMAKDLRAIRKASTNKDIVILVGGFAFDSQPELVQAVGADATALDAKRAIETATKMLGFRPTTLVKR